VSYGFDSDRSTVWLEALLPDGPVAGALCRRHADAMVLPKGWWLQDRRSDATLFTAAEPAAAEPPPPATVYRPRRPRRPPAVRSPLPLDPAAGVAAGPEPVTERGTEPGARPDAATEPVVAWVPAFDAGDDLDGLLAAKTPLLSRAFRQDAGPATPEH
jgi:hypothetical protein